MARIVFDNVTKEFGATSAVRELSLDIADGEFLVLVGPSGCGKSTALRLLAGLERITAGNIYIDDRRVNDIAAKDRDLAMVFQSYALYPHMSVRDNIAFGLKLRKLPRADIEGRVTQAAGLLSIEDLLERTPRQLSGGQRQRVALGRAIVREPAAFLLDEPLSNLDAQLRVQTRAELAKLHRRLQTTFIYVTHDQVEAMTMATRIAVLDRGVLQQLGPPQELYAAPRNIFVAGFIGSPAMNLFPATIAVADGVPVLDAGAMKVSPHAREHERLLKHAGRDVMLGIRPEHIHDPSYLPQDVDAFKVEVGVDVVEGMGSETYLHVLAGDLRLIARVDPRTTATAGQRFQVAIDATRLYVFDRETGLALGSTAD